MRLSIPWRGLAGAFGLAASAGVWAAGQDTGPAAIFAGCDGDNRPPAEVASPRERIERAPKVDRFSQRAFASFSMDEIEAGAAADGSCWARMDGVWRQAAQVVLDTRGLDSTVWGSDGPELLPLATGTYTTPRHLVVVEPDDPSTALYLATGLTGSPFVRFVSGDGLTLENVLVRGGPVKTYTATGAFEYGRTLTLSVTRSGRVRLRLDGADFYRPEPNNSQAAMEAQIPGNDPFLLSSNLEYLAASRRGYDIARQDPFYLNSNDKLEIFEEIDPRYYYIAERRVIPVTFSYIPESGQGTVYRKSLMSSEKHIQETTSHSFGASIETGGASAAYSATKSSMNSLRETESVAQAIGYSRSKKYALVLDHAYARLSAAFVDAVEDARRNFRYQGLIDKFGTHYPYAVTYGATAKMTQSFTETGYQQIAAQTSGQSGSVGATLFGVGGSISASRNAGTTTGTSGSLGSENASFVAVGGNGSWDQNGYSAGDSHYPILLDLRPIWELLNPMNFPGEPEVYQTVRTNLQRAVQRHLATVASTAGPIDATSRLPAIEEAKPEPKEEWHVYVRQAWCTGKGVGKVKRVEGRITISEGDRKTSKKTISVECKKKYDTATFSYRATDGELLRLFGTRSEMKQRRTSFDLDWIYQGTVFSQSWEKDTTDPFGTTAHPFYRNLPVGKSQDHVWKVSGDSKWPTFHLRLRFKRIK